jgi:hypothetical protein
VFSEVRICDIDWDRGIAAFRGYIGAHEIRSLCGLGWDVGSTHFPLHCTN